MSTEFKPYRTIELERDLTDGQFFHRPSGTKIPSALAMDLGLFATRGNKVLLHTELPASERYRKVFCWDSKRAEWLPQEWNSIYVGQIIRLVEPDGTLVLCDNCEQMNVVSLNGPVDSFTAVGYNFPELQTVSIRAFGG